MTFEDAKKIFFKYDCSLFTMAREEKDVYENYRLLEISKTIEEEWRQELFLILWEQLQENGSSDLYNRMYNLSINRHNRENLLIMKEALDKVSYANPKINACISETVLGRKDISERSGMIFWAYDLGEKEIAKELLRFVMNLLSIQVSDGKIMSRLERDIKKCLLISSELNITVTELK